MNMPATSPYKDVKFELSMDWKRAVYIFNQDIGVADFDLKTGKVSNPNQVTFAGVFGHHQGMFINGEVMVTGGPDFIVDLKTGKYATCSPWMNFNSYITNLFFSQDYSVGHWSARDQKPMVRAPGFFHVGWADKRQTKYIGGYQRSKDDDVTYMYVVDEAKKDIRAMNWPYASKTQPSVWGNLNRQDCTFLEASP
ncbi:hypothetical protein [Fibrella forsythiae]|uniref:Alpha-carbonic anhydrase domain-containing protein n=1 Tax=Fibrella forsythiae TaxID=2817061 RepID=A0ABS3JRA5_9BACT|nr:hypothetical protein [Fibrella forsythiae]MBO0952537.1 hypothetical protein [Fibrella forsythiae]